VSPEELPGVGIGIGLDWRKLVRIAEKNKANPTEGKARLILRHSHPSVHLVEEVRTYHGDLVYDYRLDHGEERVKATFPIGIGIEIGFKVDFFIGVYPEEAVDSLSANGEGCHGSGSEEDCVTRADFSLVAFIARTSHGDFRSVAYS
jgi:hypothetical protein